MGCSQSKKNNKSIKYIEINKIITTKKNSYKILKYINHGEYSKVYKCRDINGNIYAMKILRLSDSDNKAITNSLNKYSKNEIYKEINILNNCHHKHIIKLIDWHEDMYNMYIITEYVDGCELYDIISNDKLSEEESILIIISILKAINYLESINIRHLDIKAENIIIGKDQKIKLIDFGHSEYITSNIVNIRGTNGYIAPEIINDFNYSNNSDIWSLGCLAFFMLKSHLPYNNNDIQNGFYSDLFTSDFTISNELKQLIQNMVKIGERQSANDFLKTDFIQKNMFIYDFEYFINI